MTINGCHKRQTNIGHHYHYFNRLQITLSFIIIIIITTMTLAIEQQQQQQQSNNRTEMENQLTNDKFESHDNTFRQTINNHSNIVGDNNGEKKSSIICVEVAFVAITLLFMFSFIVYEIFCSGTSGGGGGVGGSPNEPEEQTQYMLCMSENAIYDYLLIFRVGCPSHGFDLNNSCIDFEILGQKDEMIGSPFRFDCSLLGDIVCGEMHCIIRRLTPMPTIQGIRASHSNRFHSTKTSKSSSIFFYEFELRDRTAASSADEKVVEFRLILDYIEFQPRIFRGFLPKNLNDDAMVGVYPEIPIIEMSMIEMAIFSCFTIVLSGTLCMLLEHSNFYLYKQQERQGSLYRSLQDLVFIGPVVLLVLFGNIFVYKYNIKRLATRYEYSVNQTSSDYMRYFAKSYLIFTGKLILACEAIIIYFGLKTSTTLSWYWFSSTTLTSTTVLGIWACVNKLNCMSKFYNNYANRFDSLISPTKVEMITAVSSSKQQLQQHYHQSKSDSVDMSANSSQSISYIEPKLINPKRTHATGNIQP